MKTYTRKEIPDDPEASISILQYEQNEISMIVYNLKKAQYHHEKTAILDISNWLWVIRIDLEYSTFKSA